MRQATFAERSVGFPRSAGAHFGRAAIPALAILAAVSGCTQGLSTLPPSQSTQGQAAPHLFLSDWKNGDDGMLALRTGVLIVQADGCVGLRPDGMGQPALLRWPAGTRLAEDGKGVVGLSGKRIDFGQETGLGGGFAGATLPSHCDASRWGGVYEIQQPL